MGKVRVRQIVSMSGSTGSWVGGDEHDVDEAEALRLQAAGIAEIVAGPEPAKPSKASRQKKEAAPERANDEASDADGVAPAGETAGEDGPGEPGGDSE